MWHTEPGLGKLKTQPILRESTNPAGYCSYEGGPSIEADPHFENTDPVQHQRNGILYKNGKNLQEKN